MARILESLSPLATLVEGNAQPLDLCRSLRAAVESGDERGLRELLGEPALAQAALRYAGVLDTVGRLAPGARDQLLRLEGLIEMRAQDADRWEAVMTVPPFLRGALSSGGVPETFSVLLELASRAKQRLVVAAPYLDSGFEPLLPPLARLANNGGRVLVITRELTRSTSLNAQAVARLRRRCSNQAGLEVVSWEEEGLGLHMKAAVADGQRAYVGSANFTWGGMGQHAELGVRLTGPSAGEIEKLLEAVAEELRRRRRLQTR